METISGHLTLEEQNGSSETRYYADNDFIITEVIEKHREYNKGCLLYTSFLEITI